MIRVIVIKNLAYILLLSMLVVGVPSYAAKTIEPSITLPAALTEIKIPYGVSKLDLLGRGMKEDVAIRSMDAGPAGFEDQIILLTKATPDELAKVEHDAVSPADDLHFVHMLDVSHGMAIENHQKFDDDLPYWVLSSLLRSEDNPKNVFLIVAERDPKPDLSNSIADITIKVFALKPDLSWINTPWYGFKKIKEVSVKNYDGVTEAKLRSLEEKLLNIKIEK